MVDELRSHRAAVGHKPADAADKRAGFDGSSELRRAMDSEHKLAVVLDWDVASRAAVGFQTAADC